MRGNRHFRAAGDWNNENISIRAAWLSGVIVRDVLAIGREQDSRAVSPQIVRALQRANGTVRYGNHGEVGIAFRHADSTLRTLELDQDVFTVGRPVGGYPPFGLLGTVNRALIFAIGADDA